MLSIFVILFVSLSTRCNVATVQAILDSIHWGLGSGVGALLGGVIYDSVGSVNLFLLSAALSFLSMCIACIASIQVASDDAVHDVVEERKSKVILDSLAEGHFECVSLSSDSDTDTL